MLQIVGSIRIFLDLPGIRSAKAHTDDGKLHSRVGHLLPVDLALPFGDVDADGDHRLSQVFPVDLLFQIQLRTGPFLRQFSILGQRISVGFGSAIFLGQRLFRCFPGSLSCHIPCRILSATGHNGRTGLRLRLLLGLSGFAST